MNSLEVGGNCGLERDAVEERRAALEQADDLSLGTGASGVVSVVIAEVHEDDARVVRVVTGEQAVIGQPARERRQVHVLLAWGNEHVPLEALLAAGGESRPAE